MRFMDAARLNAHTSEGRTALRGEMSFTPTAFSTPYLVNATFPMKNGHSGERILELCEEPE
jgi:hypothetical protein